MIPKIIHYCWLSDDIMPQKLQDCMRTWSEKLVDYEFVLWDLKRFDINSSLWVKQAFEAKKYAFAADYIRLFAVYNYGGIYLDSDIEVVKSFDDLLDNDIMMAYENHQHSGIEAGCFGAEKNNQLIARCLSYYTGRSFVKPDGSYDVITLPNIINQYVDEAMAAKIYSCDYFTAKNFETGVIVTTENTHAIHHFEGSWLTDREKNIIAFKQRITLRFNSRIARIYDVYDRLKYDGFRKTFMHYFRKYVLRKYSL